MFFFSFIYCEKKNIYKENTEIEYETIDSLSLSTFIINSQNDTTLYTQKGSKIEIPGNVFINGEGILVRQNVEVRIFEFDKKGDYLLNKLNTTTNEKNILESAGIIRIEAQTSEGEKIQIKTDKSIKYICTGNNLLNNSYFFERNDLKWIDSSKKGNNISFVSRPDCFYQNDSLKIFSLSYSTKYQNLNIFFDEKLKKSSFYTKEFFERIRIFFDDENVLYIYYQNMNKNLRDSDLLVLQYLKKEASKFKNYDFYNSINKLFKSTNYKKLLSLNQKKVELNKIHELYNAVVLYEIFDKRELNEKLMEVFLDQSKEADFYNSIKLKKAYLYINQITKINVLYNIDKYVEDTKDIILTVNASNDIDGNCFIIAKNKNIILPLVLNDKAGASLLKIKVPKDELLEFIYFSFDSHNKEVFLQKQSLKFDNDNVSNIIIQPEKISKKEFYKYMNLL